MPFTAKFSKDFYDRFGHKAVDELVTYLNDVNAAHRAELREASDRSWSRFDARLDQMRAEIREQVGGLRTEIAHTRADMIKWMFVFMVTGVLAVLGLR